MWFTLAVEKDSQLGLQGTLDVLQDLTGAESIRQLPTLKLFKIRMDLEMSGDTDTLAKRGVAEEPVDLEAQDYDDFDRAVIRATQGSLPVVSEPWVGAAEELGISVDELLAHLEAMKERGLGTPATRAQIIETLIARQYIQREGRALRVTSKGMKLIEILEGHPLISPDMTGDWEKQLRDIELAKFDQVCGHILDYMEQHTKMSKEEIKETF
jgi:hypothetical protein